jgi:hypothetical protein
MKKYQIEIPTEAVRTGLSVSCTLLFSAFTLAVVPCYALCVCVCVCIFGVTLLCPVMRSVTPIG